MQHEPVLHTLQRFYNRFCDPFQSYFTKSHTVRRNLVVPKRGITFEAWVRLQTPRTLFIMLVVDSFRTPIAIASALYDAATSESTHLTEVGMRDYGLTSAFCRHLHTVYAAVAAYRGI